MDLKQLENLLGACDHLKVDKKSGVYTVESDAVLDVLLQAGNSGPAPLSRVSEISLSDGFVKVKTDGFYYLLPCEVVMGLKWAQKESRSSRTGFHA